MALLLQEIALKSTAGSASETELFVREKSRENLLKQEQKEGCLALSVQFLSLEPTEVWGWNL